MSVPQKMFFVTGHGYHKFELGSFEMALREAGIQAQNLVYVSSIYPPQCEIVPKNIGLRELKPGAITYCVMARTSTNEAKRLASSAIGLALPKEHERYGYLSECHGFGRSKQEIEGLAEDLAIEFLAASLNLPFDVNKDWNERKEEWRLGGSIVKTKSVSMVKEGKKDRWLTVMAAAILLL